MNSDGYAFLLDNERYDQVKREAAQDAAADPENPQPHYWMALAHLGLDEHARAYEAARNAVSLAPEWYGAQYVLAQASLQIDSKAKEAEAAAKECIRLDPEDSTGYVLLASCHANKSRWKESEAALDKALELDPEDEAALNLRAHILSITGRRAEAMEMSLRTLGAAPDSVQGMTTLGYTQLRAGKIKEAEESFVSALRQDPNEEFAREGLLESLRVKFWPYRLVFAFHVWQARFPSSVRWGLWIGIFVAGRLLREAGKQGGPGAVFITAASIALMSFVYLTWTSALLANGMLLLHPLGRYALPKQDKIEGAFGMTAAVIGLVGLVGWLITRDGGMGAGAAFAALTLFLVGLASFLQSLPWLRVGLVWTLGIAGCLLSLALIIL